MAKAEPIHRTREDLIHFLNANTGMATAWITAKGAIVRFPGVTPATIPDIDATSFRDLPVLVIDGAKGLAAIDPDWNGEGLTICPHGKYYNADWLKHDQLRNGGKCCPEKAIINPSLH